MSIQHPVGVGTLLMCDYQTGFVPPEMIKRRPAVVVSPRLPYRDNLCAIVPLSTTAPSRVMPYHCELNVAALQIPPPWNAPVVWAKADMLATVCFSRLDLFRTNRDQYGKRQYLHPKLHPDQITALQGAILHGLGLGALTKTPMRTHIERDCVRPKPLRLKTAADRGKPRRRRQACGAFCC